MHVLEFEQTFTNRPWQVIIINSSLFVVYFNFINLFYFSSYFISHYNFILIITVSGAKESKISSSLYLSPQLVIEKQGVFIYIIMLF